MFKGNGIKGGFLNILPSNKYSDEIVNLDETLLNIFKDIQYQTNRNKWHIVILLSKILITHIAVNKGANENLKFKEYVKYLEKQNLLNDNLSKLMNSIKDMDNKLNHEIDWYKSENCKFQR